MILIVTNSQDDHTPVVISALEDERIPYFRFDTDQYPTQVQLSMSFNRRDEAANFLCADGRKVDLAEITSVWYRRPRPPICHGVLSAEDERFSSLESQHLLQALWQLLEDRHWVSPIAALNRAENKPYQLRKAIEAGFAIPRTIMTNSAEGLLQFTAQIQSDIAYKPFNAHFREHQSGVLSVYTNRLTRDYVRDQTGRLCFAPGIFQEYIDKAFELRITVIGDDIFAMAIESQRSERTQTDWRHYDLSQGLYRPYNLNEETRNSIRCLMSSLELSFGCIDMIVTPTGDHIFLEINPNGQWYWVEMLTEQPLLSAFLKLLCNF